MSIPDKAVEALHEQVVTQFRRHGQYSLADARDALEAAEPYLTGGVANIPRGLYRNAQGAELRVIGAIGTRIGIDVGTDQLSIDIAYAETANDPYFKGRYLVTSHSLKQCGYELIEAEEVKP